MPWSSTYSGPEFPINSNRLSPADFFAISNLRYSGAILILAKHNDRFALFTGSRDLVAYLDAADLPETIATFFALNFHLLDNPAPARYKEISDAVPIPTDLDLTNFSL